MSEGLSRADEETLRIAKSRGLSAQPPSTDELRRDIEALDAVLGDAVHIIQHTRPYIEDEASEFMLRAFNVREYTRFLLGRMR